MGMLIRNSLVWVWLLLMLITLTTWWFATQDAVSFDVSTLPDWAVSGFVVIVLVSIVKMRLIIWHFMEVRHSPAWLRWTCDAWLISLALILLGMYWQA